MKYFILICLTYYTLILLCINSSRLGCDWMMKAAEHQAWKKLGVAHIQKWTNEGS